MKQTKIYGVALIIGALGTIVTMVFHPTGADLLHQNSDTASRGEFAALVTHSIALFSYPLLGFGLLGIYRRMENRHLTSAALIAYFFGGVGVMIAAAMSGLIAPSITREILSADDSTRPILHLLLDYNFSINQAFTKIFVVASSLSILLWSLSIRKAGKLALGIGIFGFLVSIVSLAALFGGHLRLDVHGFGTLAFSQATWFILVGVFMLTSKEE